MRIRSALAVFFISIFILFPIRLTTLLSGTDLSGNMFIGGTMPNVFLAVLILSVLLIFIISKKSSNVPSYVRVRRSIPCTFASLITAGLLAYDSVLALGGEYIDIFPDSRSIVYGVSGLLSAVVLLLFAFSFLTGNPVASGVPIVILIPSIWACIRLTFMFMNFTTVAGISVYYFDIGYYICLLIFLFGQAKIFSSIETRRSVRSAVWSGLLCCIFSLLSVCTRLYINTFKDVSFTESAIVPRLIDAFIIIYILCYLFFITKGEHKTGKHEDIHFIHYQPSNDYSNFWNDWSVSQNLQIDQIDQVKPIGRKISISPVNPNNQIEQHLLVKQPNSAVQFEQTAPVMQAVPAQQTVPTQQTAPAQSDDTVDIASLFKSISEAEQISQSAQSDRLSSAPTTAVPKVSISKKTSEPSSVDAPADYYEDEDNISIFSDKKLLKSELNTQNAETELNGNSNNPTAHIEGTVTASAVPVSTTPQEVPDYIETPDGVYVRVVDTINSDQVVDASPDEAPSLDTKEKNSDRPKLAKGYVPKSTVTKSDEGYCLINSIDE